MLFSLQLHFTKLLDYKSVIIPYQCKDSTRSEHKIFLKPFLVFKSQITVFQNIFHKRFEKQCIFSRNIKSLIVYLPQGYLIPALIPLNVKPKIKTCISKPVPILISNLRNKEIFNETFQTFSIQTWI